MGYTVFSLGDDDGHLGTGLSLTEAFARMMAFARCDYTFGREQGDMRLQLKPLEDEPEEYFANPATRERFVPEHRSKLPDDNEAREELMLRLLKRGVRGIRIVTDEQYEREETRRRNDQNESEREFRVD